MQAAHPLVAQGAIDHSAFASDPFGRLDPRLIRNVLDRCSQDCDVLDDG